jgi:Nickel responsive protein SCO4226-like
MKKFVIERKIEGVGRMNDRELSSAAGTSNKALAQLAPRVQWVHSYVTADRTFCIYLAEDEAMVHEHARIRGFPATRVYEVLTMIDPTTESRDKLAQVA